MIKFTEIEINNFMSIDHVKLTFPDGITELVGNNLDAGGSNGTGKSSLLLAIPQCLFNKNPSIGLQKVNNIITGKPYTIKLHIETDDAYYTIDNNRNTNSITITKNGEVITTRIKESLEYIESEILNLTYNEFIALTFITADSLKSIFDITSANLLLKLFSLNKLDEYTDKLKMERRTLSSELAKIRIKVPTQVGNIKDIEEAIEDLSKEIEVKNAELQALLEEDSSIDTKRLKELQDIKIMNSKGVCPTCHQVIKVQEFDESELQSLLNNRNTINTKMVEINKAIQQLTTSLKVQEAKLVAMMEVSQNVYNSSKEAVRNLQDKIDIINSTLKIIAQGTVHQVYLNQFLRTLNNNLLSSQKGNYKIRALLDNSSITYKIQTDSQDKYIEQLSGGESTTIALVILVSIFKTLKQLLNIDLNLLILDEAIHMVDSNNKEFISEVIKSMNKNIFIVQHEDNIDPKIFNNRIELVKHKGLTTLKDIT